MPLHKSLLLHVNAHSATVVESIVSIIEEAEKAVENRTPFDPAPLDSNDRSNPERVSPSWYELSVQSDPMNPGKHSQGPLVRH
jgi:hypothetical protein